MDIKTVVIGPDKTMDIKTVVTSPDKTMDVKMVVTDLDRTLLHTDKTLSAYTVSVLERCRSAGLKIAFATARPRRGVTHYFEMFTPDALIVHNGAAAYIMDVGNSAATYTTNAGNDTTAYTTNAGNDTAAYTTNAGNDTAAYTTDAEYWQQIYSAGIAPPLRDATLTALNHTFPEATLSVEINNTLYANANLFKVWQEADATRVSFHENDMVSYKADGHPLASAFTQPADKIIIGVANITELDRYTPLVPDGLYLEMSHGEGQHLGLIMHRNATKWAALQAVAAYYDIPTEEIITFGDDYNDIEMVKNAGTGIAVANAIPEVISAANYTCDYNNNNGPAKWLEEYLDIQAEIKHYRALPFTLNDHINLSILPEGALTDNEITLICMEKYPGNAEKKYVPAYEFDIYKIIETPDDIPKNSLTDNISHTDSQTPKADYMNPQIGKAGPTNPQMGKADPANPQMKKASPTNPQTTKIGRINLRIGYGGGPYNSNLYYGGQIGYNIDEPHRGNNYAARACRLLVPVAKAHNMHTLLITNDAPNHASKRVCEKLGARLIRTAPLPVWHELYRDGQRFSNIYEWRICVEEQTRALLHTHGKDKIFRHVKAVAEVSVKIAKQYNLDPIACEIAAYLHDISAIMPYADMLRHAEENAWHIHEAERALPLLLHQRISREIAETRFRITDERILSAIKHHTTLRADATSYDMAVFIADKLAWDQDEMHGAAPFFDAVSHALESSLESACLTYMDYMIENNLLFHRHPWFDEARSWLRKIIK